jgi:hypothetical protein
MKKLFILILVLVLVLDVRGQQPPGTAPFIFPVNLQIGGVPIGKNITLTTPNSLITDGFNLWAGNYQNVQAGTNPAYLYPNTYLLTVPGVVKPARFTVYPSDVGTNIINVNSRLTSGPLFYFGTNGFANIWGANGINITTNSDGSFTISLGRPDNTTATNVNYTGILNATGGNVFTNPLAAGAHIGFATNNGTITISDTLSIPTVVSTVASNPVVYVDSNLGNDTNPGVLPDLPLQTLNAAVLIPGVQTISLAAGNQYTGNTVSLPFNVILKGAGKGVTFLIDSNAVATTPITVMDGDTVSDLSTPGQINFGPITNTVTLRNVEASTPQYGLTAIDVLNFAAVNGVVTLDNDTLRSSYDAENFNGGFGATFNLINVRVESIHAQGVGSSTTVHGYRFRGTNTVVNIYGGSCVMSNVFTSFLAGGGGPSGALSNSVFLADYPAYGTSNVTFNVYGLSIATNSVNGCLFFNDMTGNSHLNLFPPL